MKTFQEILKEKRECYGNTEAAIEFAAEEYADQDKRSHRRLRECVREVLYSSMTTAGGGYVSQFGPHLFGELRTLTEFDINKRKINETAEKILESYGLIEDDDMLHCHYSHVIGAMEEYADQFKEPAEIHDCHGKGYVTKGNTICCAECGRELFDIIGYKNQKHL